NSEGDLLWPYHHLSDRYSPSHRHYSPVVSLGMRANSGVPWLDSREMKNPVSLPAAVARSQLRHPLPGGTEGLAAPATPTLLRRARIRTTSPTLRPWVYSV